MSPAGLPGRHNSLLEQVRLKFPSAVQPLRETVWSFLRKIKNRVTIGPSDTSPVCLPEKFENTHVQRHMYPCVQSSIIHGAQDRETAGVPFDRGLGEGAVARLCYGTLLSHKKTKWYHLK